MAPPAWALFVCNNCIKLYKAFHHSFVSVSIFIHIFASKFFIYRLTDNSQACIPKFPFWGLNKQNLSCSNLEVTIKTAGTILLHKPEQNSPNHNFIGQSISQNIAISDWQQGLHWKNSSAWWTYMSLWPFTFRGLCLLQLCVLKVFQPQVFQGFPLQNRDVLTAKWHIFPKGIW